MYIKALPAELLRKVLRHSVHITGLLDTDWFASQGPGQPGCVWTGWPTVTDLITLSPLSMKTRMSIILVCQLWHRIGMEFLYECVRIRRQEDIPTLLAMFKVQVGQPPHAQKGWWTKRVEVAIMVDRIHEVHLLSRLLKCYYNVQILSAPWRSFRPDGNPFYPLIPTIIHQFRHSLRRMPLTIDHTSLLDTHTDWLQAISFQSLEIDITSPSSNSSIIDDGPNPTTIFATVTTLTLTLDAFNEEQIPWHFPQLQRLSLVTTGSNVYSFLRPFLYNHAATLIILHIASADVVKDLSPALVPCVSLKELSLDHVELDRLSPTFILPNVERLRIHVLPASNRIQKLAQSLDDALSGGILPNLREVQVGGTYDRANTSHIAILRLNCTKHCIELRLIN